MTTKADCKKRIRLLKSAFDMSMQLAIDDGEPAEHGVSDYKFAHDYGYVSEVIEDALDEVGRSQINKCMDLEDARDILEAHWQIRQAKGDYDGFDTEVEPL